MEADFDSEKELKDLIKKLEGDLKRARKKDQKDQGEGEDELEVRCSFHTISLDITERGTR